MEKEELFKKVGSLQQVAYVRPFVYKEGRSEQMNAYEVKSGDITFHVMADKCMDISDLSYKGMNMTFMAKGGLEGRNPYDTNGLEAQRSIMGGLFFTCGLENVCAPCTVDGKDYPMHGRMRTTPAEFAGADAHFEDNDYVIRLSGEMREAELFGENMVLRRSIETKLGTNSIVITDEIENQSFRKEPLMLLYHCNSGYPFLDESVELVLPTRKVTGREEFSEQHRDRWNHFESPVDNEPEYVFLHDMAGTADGRSIALVINHNRNVALRLEFTQRFLPYFMEWKSIGSGDYVLGLEPSNSIVYGKQYNIEHNLVHYLEPFQKETNRLVFSVLEGDEQIIAARKEIESLH